jgi:archaellum component FlaF (FlaF/FlaG flagellin family)
VTNSGNIVLDSDEISILVDGYLLNYDYYPETAKWYPGETKMYAVGDVSESASKRVKIVTDSGVAGYIDGIPEE